MECNLWFIIWRRNRDIYISESRTRIRKINFLGVIATGLITGIGGGFPLWQLIYDNMPEK